MQEKTYSYRCKKCDWKGTEQELESELVDTCMGDEPISLCPKCGSYEVVITIDEEDNIE